MPRPARPHRVAVLAFEGISPFHLSVPCAIFGDRAAGTGSSGYEIAVVASTPGPLRTSAGFQLIAEHGIEYFEQADTIVLPSADPSARPEPEVVQALRAAHQRGARLVGLCLGAFTVAATGVLDGRAAATHWAYADELAAQYQAVPVRSDLLWSDHHDVLTSAGAAAALDACLHIVREDRGVDAALAVARNLVLAPHREGNQAQYLTRPLVAADRADPIDQAMTWASRHLGEPITVDRWSRQVALSRRTFTRRFRQRTGLSGQAWLLTRRLELARSLLERSDRSIEQVAADAGFGTAQLLRHHFRHHLNTTPTTYRRAFGAN